MLQARAPRQPEMVAKHLQAHHFVPDTKRVLDNGQLNLGERDFGKLRLGWA